jgi:hypothetical protein
MSHRLQQPLQLIVVQAAPAASAQRITCACTSAQCIPTHAEVLCSQLLHRKSQCSTNPGLPTSSCHLQHHARPSTQPTCSVLGACPLPLPLPASSASLALKSASPWGPDLTRILWTWPSNTWEGQEGWQGETCEGGQSGRRLTGM